jgi:GNAT superfamily N-acetyltransferase
VSEPPPENVRIRDAKMPAENEARERVSTEAQKQAYKDIFTSAELERFANGDAVPGWELGNLRYAFVAEIEGVIVGMADLTELRDHWMLVEPMYVRPDYQRSGIGTKLWTRCLKAAAHRKAPGVRVWALEKNQLANNFYVKQGCKPKHNGQLCVGEHCEPAIGYEFPL